MPAALVPNPLLPSTSTRPSGKSKRTFYVAFCAARNPSWWMLKFLKADFSHCLVLQPITHEFCVSGQKSWLENCFSIEFAGYAIMQQYYRWIETPFDHLQAAAVAKLWAEKGWRVVRLEREVDEGISLSVVCNLVMSCVTLSKCLMGVSCVAQTPFQLYKWMLRNGGEEITGG